jgi:hypothetical protein
MFLDRFGRGCGTGRHVVVGRAQDFYFFLGGLGVDGVELLDGVSGVEVEIRM